MNATENIYVIAGEDVDLVVRLLTPINPADTVTFTATSITKETPTGITLFPSFSIRPDIDWPTTCELVYNYISIHLTAADIPSLTSSNYSIVAAGVTLLSGTLYVGSNSCLIKYSDWPDSTVIPNEGLAASCDGTSNADDYAVSAVGAPIFHSESGNDYVAIGPNAVVNNLHAHTIEILVYIVSSGNAVARVFDKTDSNYRGYFLYFNNTTGGNYVALRRDGVATDTYVEWHTAVGSLNQLGFNEIQVSWDASSVANLPTIVINGVSYTMGNGGLTDHGSATFGNAPTAWVDDSANKLALINSYSYPEDFGWPGAICVFRLYSGALVSGQLVSNVAADAWRTTVIPQAVVKVVGVQDTYKHVTGTVPPDTHKRVVGILQEIM